MQFLGRWFITFIASWAALNLVPGIYFESNPWLTLSVLSLVLAFLNWSIKPILQIIGLPVTILTLGIFYLVINTFILMLASWLTGAVFGLGVFMPFGSAFFASIIVSIISVIVSAVTGL